jgi:hypothetical protein
MTATAHHPAGAWTHAHRAALTIVALAVALAAALAILVVRLAAGGPSTPAVDAGTSAVLQSVDDGCTVAQAGRPC